MYYTKPIIALVAQEHFCTVMHSHAVPFQKPVLITETSFVNSKTKAMYLKSLIVYESKLKKSNFIVDFFLNFAYVNSYLQTKTFSRRRDCAITS